MLSSSEAQPSMLTPPFTRNLIIIGILITIGPQYNSHQESKFYITAYTELPEGHPESHKGDPHTISICSGPSIVNMDETDCVSPTESGPGTDEN